ncbi:hypothetical protein [Pseudonocardia oroxyli]|uniref:Uncharacterized protein n=1 Tax=Pseudonocardia oroxyli TaxID=366584 RepID=A0A1G7TEE5_PSEOR|nr:hypothetical protein [Pseudonocardia oroxyli]SDG33673.1 hypothetical protein SAMN05216377_1114 [Pseudonocardia oroxyli]
MRERVRREVPVELAEQLSVFWADAAGVRDGAGEHDRLPEVDRLDLLESGRLLAGNDVRAGAARPRTDDLVRQAAEFALAKFDDAYLARLRDPDALLDGGPRPVTKAVLFPVRFLYTKDTGRVGRNDDAATWYPTRHPHGALVAAAAAWRTEPPDPAAARELLVHHLRPIYVIFAEEYARALRLSGDLGLADRVASWGTSVR